MRKFIFSISMIVLAMLSSWGQGQNDPVIKIIQKAYAEAEAQIAMGEEEHQAKNMMTVDIDQMWPGSGRHNEKIQFYFTLDNERGNWGNTLYLVRKTHNVAAREFYEEYLYDIQEKGSPLFCLYTYYNNEGERRQLRLYFNNGKPYKQVPEAAPVELEPDIILGEFGNYYDVFRKLVGRL